MRHKWIITVSRKRTAPRFDAAHRLSGAGTPTRRYDGRAFGQWQDERVAVLAVGLGNAGRRQGRSACHRPQGHRSVAFLAFEVQTLRSWQVCHVGLLRLVLDAPDVPLFAPE